MNYIDDKNNARYLKYRTRFFISEFIGTGILLFGGLSLVIFMFGTGSPGPQLIPDLLTRQLITGFLFGGLGASIALSPIGTVSGAHINPAVTMVFWLYRKIEGRLAITYVAGPADRGNSWLPALAALGSNGTQYPVRCNSARCRIQY